MQEGRLPFETLSVYIKACNCAKNKLIINSGNRYMTFRGALYFVVGYANCCDAGVDE